MFKVLAIFLLVIHGQLSLGVIQTQCKSPGMYAMTWDDGPGQYTNQLLDVLASKNVKATFHLTTKYLTDPNIQSMIQRIASAGHLIGLRTEADWNLFQMSDDQIRAGIARQANVMASFVGFVPKFVRLPYNGFDTRVLKAVESTGAVVTNYNLETYDYAGDGGRTFNAVKLALSLVGNGQGSFISIQHDSVQQSVGVTSKIIDLAKSSGYRLVKLDECLGLGDLTKNKDPLKGATDSLALDPMSGAGIPSDGSVSSPGVDGNQAPLGADGNPIAGQAAGSVNFAVNHHAGAAGFATIIAFVMALLLLQF